VPQCRYKSAWCPKLNSRQHSSEKHFSRSSRRIPDLKVNNCFEMRESPAFKSLFLKSTLKIKPMKKILLVCISLLLFLASCEPDELEYEDYRPIVAVPLIHSILDVYDVLERVDSLNELIVIDDDGLLALTYQGKLFSLELDDVLNFPNISESFNGSITAGQATSLNSGLNATFSASYPIELNIDVESSTVRIDSILLEGGDLQLNINLIQDEFVAGSLTIPGLFDAQGDPVIIAFVPSDFVNGVLNRSINLAGYRLFPTYTPPNDNAINLNAELSLSDNTDNTASAGQFFNASLSLNNFNFSYVFGYFGQIAVNTDQDSVTIRIFENAIDGYFHLEEATINLLTTNSFGLPVSVGFTNISSINLNTGVITPLNLSESFEIGGQETINSSPSISNFVIDNNNSNIGDFLEPTPKTVFFQLNATSNPDGEPIPPNTNFVASGSRLDVDIEVLLPLFGYAQDIIIRDTLDTEISFDDFDEVDSLELKLFTINGFPADAEIQLTFLDEFDNVIDFLFEGGQNNLTLFMESGITNDQGIVISSTELITTRTLDAVGAENLEQTRKIIVTSRLNTFESDLQNVVRFMDDYTLEVKLGVKIFGNIEL